MDNKTISVCFITDEGYVLPTSVALTSLCCNMAEDHQYDIYILTPKGISYENKRSFIDIGYNYKNVKITIIENDISELASLHISNDNKYLAATPTALLKFKIADIFKDLDKILYLDGDIIVRDDLIKLYNTGLGDNYAAAVRDLPQVLYDVQPLGGDISGREYFNSGVMLLNLKKIREDKLYDSFVETKKNCVNDSLMDQNVLNIVFKNKVVQLPFVYNVCYINLIESRERYGINKINELYGTSYNNIYEAAPDICIMHFSSKLKPWYFYDVPFADEWMKYYFLSPFRTKKLQRIFHDKRNIDIRETKALVEQLSEKGYSRRVIPVVFATNLEYAPFAAATIESIHKNGNPGFFYDIGIIIDKGMPMNMKKRLSDISYDNLKVTLWDVRNCFNDIDLYSVGHYSKQMYYRLLIPEIFTLYDKVIYLDCDIIVNTDIAELYDVKLENNYIAAANNFLRDNLLKHVTKRLKLEPSEYINSGVLVFNNRLFMQDNIKEKCFEHLKSFNKLPCPDQDIINLACRGKILKLDDRWNFQWHHQFKDAVKGNFLEDYSERYEKLLSEDVFIVHYTSSFKPWAYPDRFYAEYFWKYCRETDFYEHVLFKEIRKLTDKNEKSTNIAVNSEQKQRLNYEIQETQNSFTFKLARTFNRKLSVLPENNSLNESELLQYLNDLRNSTSYKLAAFLTWLPRKIRK